MSVSLLSKAAYRGITANNSAGVAVDPAELRDTLSSEYRFEAVCEHPA